MASDSTPAATAEQSAVGTPGRAVSAEQLLTGVLALIRTSQRLDDISPAQLKAVLGIDVEHARDGSGRYGAGGALAPGWMFGVEVVPAGTRGLTPRFTFEITPATAGETPDMTAICQPDFEQFAARVQAMGLRRTPYHAEHGRYLNDRYTKGPLSIEVSPGAQLDPATMAIVRTCVRSILIGQGGADTTETDSGIDNPALSAEEVGRRFLKLIESVKSRDDLTREHVQAAMGLMLKDGPNGPFRTQPLDGDWLFVVSLGHETPPGTSISLSLEFIHEGERFADMSSICAPDFETYHDALKARGYRDAFQYDQINGEVGRLVGVSYVGDGMNVDILPEVRRFPDGKLHPACVRRISLATTN
ncbi:MAG: hypothetical protein ACTHOH_01235 [Lysobacteraceae bacterium]